MKVSSCITVIFHREPSLQILLPGRVFLNTFISLLLSLFSHLILKHIFSPLHTLLLSSLRLSIICQIRLNVVKYVYVISYHHRMVVEGVPGDPLVQHPCSKQGRLEQVAQGSVRLDTDFLSSLLAFCFWNRYIAYSVVSN